MRVIITAGNLYRRALGLFFHLIGARAAYAIMGAMGRVLYALALPVRQLSEGQCRLALAGRYRDEEIAGIARTAFVHRNWNLVDLLLAPRRIGQETYARIGGRVPQPFLDLLRAAQAKQRPVILVTAYYGPYDLLPLLLGYNGLPAAAIYRRHPNPGYDAYRLRVRSASGCHMILDKEAIDEVPRVLERGGTVAILADHHVPRRGVETTFLGAPTSAPRSVALLAARYRAVVAVAGIRRANRAFHFQIVVEDLFDERAWAGADEVGYITERYIAALERLILADPTQYLWAHPRWGSTPSVSAPQSDQPP